MPPRYFDRFAIPISLARGGELRVGVPLNGATSIDLEVFRDPRAPRAEASASLTPDGARALIHALETALEEAGEGRPRPRPVLRARDMRPSRAKAA